MGSVGVPGTSVHLLDWHRLSGALGDTRQSRISADARASDLEEQHRSGCSILDLDLGKVYLCGCSLAEHNDDPMQRPRHSQCRGFDLCVPWLMRPPLLDELVAERGAPSLAAYCSA